MGEIPGQTIDFPLSSERRAQLEEECEEIVEAEDFGRDKFESFRENIQNLARKEGDLKGIAVLHDKEAKILIEIGDKSITIRTDPSTIEGSNTPTINQNISYIETQDAGGKAFHATLRANDSVKISKRVTSLDYFRNKKVSRSVSGIGYVKRIERVSDEAVQAFCRRAYEVYVKNKEAAVNSLPQ